MRWLFSLTLSLGLFSSLIAQNNFWKPLEAASISLPSGAERRIQPAVSQTFQLDYAGIKAALSNAPMEFTASAKQNPIILQLPLADGSLHLFKVWESPVMAPELMAKFPELRTYAGEDAAGLGMRIRLGLGYKGFHAYIFDAHGQVQTVSPYASGTHPYYMAYRQSDLPMDAQSSSHRSTCGVEAAIDVANFHKEGQASANDRDEAENVMLKKYRLAVTAQGEYSQYHGGNKPQIMSAIVEAVNYIVAIQERDWAIRLELVPNNDTLIFLDPDTDPFSGPLIPNWIGDNPSAINGLIGVNNYDIGHLFSRVVNPSGVYVAGQAALSGVCTQIDKAVAGSSLPNPEGSEYYLIIAHEMGHQFSATHTFNSCPPAQDAQTPGTAYEPGGGSTIMSYATTCTPDIVADRDPFYHVASIEQVTNFTTVEIGSTCPHIVTTDNHYPEVDIPLTDNFYIPISTPFSLTGVATDQDNDNLTYSWEQFDKGPIAPLGQPIEGSPIFRSFPPDVSSTRTFPRITTIVSNTNNKTEVLPTYNRNLTFKLTVRDNFTGSGGVAIDEVRFKTTNGAGPFRVSYPNAAAIIWNIGEFQTVTWDVANTNGTTVNCQKVNIRLSVDGGFTYPILLAENQPNIGRACVQVPDNPATSARIKVEAADNIFFDISNFNFKIQAAATATFSLCAGTLKDLVCLPTPFTTVISTTALAGFSEEITLSATGLPNGATGTFSPNPVPAGAASTFTLSFPANTTESTFDIMVLGTTSAGMGGSTITLSTISNDFSPIAPIAPANHASGINPQPLLQWNKAVDADAYEVELASNPSFEAGSIIASNLNTNQGSFQITSPLTEGGVYFWRVRGKNVCGYSPWSSTQIFVVSVLSCVQFQASDLPKNISANGTPTVESKITLLAGGQVSDVNITTLQGYHEYFKDLEAHLISPAGTDVLLWKDRCGSSNGNFNMGFDDGAAAVFSCPPPNNNADSKPNGFFSTFEGENAAGVWTLRIKDNAISGGGSLSNFELQICSNEATNPPIVTVNNSLQLPSGNNAGIGTDLLKSDDANNSAAQLTYTLVTIPQNGLLQWYGNNLVIGSQFSQADIDNGALRYFDYGLNLGTDAFQFIVADGEGGLDADIFTISPLVGTKELLQGLSFDLSPNPADEVLQLSLNESLTSDALVSIYNTAGQQVASWTLAAGAKQLTLQVPDLSQGVYAISIENEAVRGVRKVVIR